MRSRAELLEGVAFEQAESPRWDSRGDRLVWVDMARGDLHLGRIDGGAVVSDSVVRVGTSIGFAAPLEREGEGWVCVRDRGVVHVSEGGEVRTILDDVAVPGTQFNDGVCDRSGVLWAGTQSHARVPDAALFSIGQDATVRTRLTDVTVSNGLGFSPDGTRMYYIDTLPRRQLEAFDVVDGELRRRRTLATITDGNPDGLAVDREGGVWVAIWDAGEVRRFDDRGSLTHRITVSARRPTAVCFVGSLLVVPTARLGLHDPSPEDGRFFGIDVGIAGEPASPWRPTAEVLARVGAGSAVPT